MELVTNFSSYLSSIQPDENDVKDAKAAHEKMREQLRIDEGSKDAHLDTFLSGSYARHTAINDINDVDIICILDIDRTTTEPEVVLAWLQQILSEYYDKPRPQGRSVGAKGAKGVWLDVVPAALSSTDDAPLWIPDRNAKAWVQTHPKGQIAASASKNKATDGYFIHTVKLLKSWRDRLPNDSCRPKSYILEALIHKTIGYPASHAVAVVNALEGIERNYGIYRDSGTVPTIDDPGYSGINIAKRWSAEDFKAFMTELKTAAATARSALNSSDETESRKLWRRLFGSTFGQ